MVKFRSIIAIVLTLACVFCLLQFPASADTVIAVQTGDPNRQPLSKQALADALNSITDATKTYQTEPSVSAPYSTGSLHSSFLQEGLDYLNYIRAIAHLAPVQLDDELSQQAQYGAVLLAANNNLTHYPTKPWDMSLSFYNQGYAATTSSNLSMGYRDLTGHIQGCMDDSCSQSNLEVVGHRRWLLCSRLLNVGFGFAQKERPYSVTKIFDRSAPQVDFDVISWPASGNMPSDIFRYDTPWSITVNTSLYRIDEDAIQVTVTNQTTGEVWRFDQETPSTPNGSNSYFRVDQGGYGDYYDSALIFRPATNKEFSYDGVYTVKISGLEDKQNRNTAVTLTYDVDFFDPDYSNGPVIFQQPVDEEISSGDTAQFTVEAIGEGASYRWWIKNPGEQDFDQTNETSNTYNIKATRENNGTQLYCVITDRSGRQAKSQTVTVTVKGQEPPAPPADPVRGDFTGDGIVDNGDVEYLLWATLFPDEYTLCADGDINRDGAVDNQDVEYLLWHTLFPGEYPLNAQ